MCVTRFSFLSFCDKWSRKKAVTCDAQSQYRCGYHRSETVLSVCCATRKYKDARYFADDVFLTTKLFWILYDEHFNQFFFSMCRKVVIPRELNKLEKSQRKFFSILHILSWVCFCKYFSLSCQLANTRPWNKFENIFDFFTDHPRKERC